MYVCNYADSRAYYLWFLLLLFFSMRVLNKHTHIYHSVYLEKLASKSIVSVFTYALAYTIKKWWYHLIKMRMRLLLFIFKREREREKIRATFTLPFNGHINTQLHTYLQFIDIARNEFIKLAFDWIPFFNSVSFFSLNVVAVAFFQSIRIQFVFIFFFCSRNEIPLSFFRI